MAAWLAALLLALSPAMVAFPVCAQGVDPMRPLRGGQIPAAALVDDRAADAPGDARRDQDAEGLPRLLAVMTLSDGPPRALFAWSAPGTTERWFQRGELIGDYRLVAITTSYVDLVKGDDRKRLRLLPELETARSNESEVNRARPLAGPRRSGGQP